MSGLLPNEITVRLVSEPNSANVYQVMYGKVCILRLLSVPSDDDIKTALNNYRSQPIAQDSDRVKQLAAKNFRHGQFPRDDDDPRAV